MQIIDNRVQVSSFDEWCERENLAVELTDTQGGKNICASLVSKNSRSEYIVDRGVCIINGIGETQESAIQRLIQNVSIRQIARKNFAVGSNPVTFFQSPKFI